MSTIKKAFQPIINILETNTDKKVSAVLEEVIALAAAKTGGGGRSASTILRDAKGAVTHVFCYYHKMWEDVNVAEYGAKASSATGLSNMCKEGTSAWSKQQAAAKKAKEEMLAAVGTGELAPDAITKQLEKVEQARNKIVPREDKHGSKDAPAE